MHMDWCETAISFSTDQLATAAAYDIGAAIYFESLMHAKNLIWLFLEHSLNFDWTKKTMTYEPFGPETRWANSDAYEGNAIVILLADSPMAGDWSTAERATRWVVIAGSTAIASAGYGPNILLGSVQVISFKAAPQKAFYARE